MTHGNSSVKKVWYGLSEGFEARSQRRLQNDLGVDEAATEAILHLRSQVMELQSRVRQLEGELDSENANQNLRLSRYREVYFDAIWIELESE